jgi:hypothetical protein
MSQEHRRMDDAPVERLRRSTPTISDDAFRRATGKGPEEWFALLDQQGAQQQRHAEIARWLAEEQGVDGWWSQMITVSYERARGLREPHQKADGFAVSVSRTFDLDAEAIEAWFTHDALRDRWLEPGLLRLRTVQLGRSARFDVEGTGSRLGVWLTRRPNGKTAVQLQHERLPDADAVEEWRAFWKAHLDQLGTIIAGL